MFLFLLSQGHVKPRTFTFLPWEPVLTTYRIGRAWDDNHLTNLQIVVCTHRGSVTWRRQQSHNENERIIGWSPYPTEGQCQGHKHSSVDDCPGLGTSRTPFKFWDPSGSALKLSQSEPQRSPNTAPLEALAQAPPSVFAAGASMTPGHFHPAHISPC